MKRVLTKKPQFEKQVLAERPKRTLKFTHARDDAPEMVADPLIAAPVHDWGAASPDAPAMKTPPRSPAEIAVAVVLPLLALGILAAAVYGLAQTAGYDAAFLASRLT